MTAQDTTIYFDHASTTPCDQRVVDAMLPYFTSIYGNSSSRNHAYGWEAENGVDTARSQVADLLGAQPKEIIFTSGATESNNIAIKARLGCTPRPPLAREHRGHIITAVHEHKAVIDPVPPLGT